VTWREVLTRFKAENEVVGEIGEGIASITLG